MAVQQHIVQQVAFDKCDCIVNRVCKVQASEEEKQVEGKNSISNCLSCYVARTLLYSGF